MHPKRAKPLHAACTVACIAFNSNSSFGNAENRFQYVRVGGKHHRVDHCLFADKPNMSPVLAAAGGQHVRVDHNHFRDIPHVRDNGKEIFQIVGIGSDYHRRLT